MVQLMVSLGSKGRCEAEMGGSCLFDEVVVHQALPLLLPGAGLRGTVGHGTLRPGDLHKRGGQPGIERSRSPASHSQPVPTVPAPRCLMGLGSACSKRNLVGCARARTGAWQQARCTLVCASLTASTTPSAR